MFLLCFDVEVIGSGEKQMDDIADKEVEELPSGDLRRRLGKKSIPNQSDSKEETSPAAITTDTERIVVRYVYNCKLFLYGYLLNCHTVCISGIFEITVYCIAGNFQWVYFQKF